MSSWWIVLVISMELSSLSLLTNFDLKYSFLDIRIAKLACFLVTISYNFFNTFTLQWSLLLMVFWKQKHGFYFLIYSASEHFIGELRSLRSTVFIILSFSFLMFSWTSFDELTCCCLLIPCVLFGMLIFLFSPISSIILFRESLVCSYHFKF